MDETTARTSPSPAQALDRDLGTMLDAVATVPGEALRRRLDHAIVDIMGAIPRELVFPVERLLPALRPAP